MSYTRTTPADRAEPTGVAPAFGAELAAHTRRRSLNPLWLRVPVGLRRRKQYLSAHGRVLRLNHPRRWSEKINWRIAYDRRELLEPTCDKQAMKQHARLVAGPADLGVPRTVWTGTDPADLGASDWPERWVYKPNHGTGQAVFGTGQPDIPHLRELARNWLSRPGPEIWGEWAYGRARRCVFIEEMIPGTPAAGLPDYKFFVFDGVPVVIQVDDGRFARHLRRFYTPDWRPLETRCDLPLAPVTDPPARLDEMLDIAGRLAAEFDHLRVDLYQAGDQVWFGELTPYSGGGLTPFDPPELDELLGSAWTLPQL